MIQDTVKKNKTQILTELRKKAAEISQIELKRNTGDYVSIHELVRKKKEFRNLSKQYKKFFNI